MFHIQVNCTQGIGTFHVNAVDAHEGIGDELSAIGGDGIAVGLCDDLDRHAWLEHDAVAVLALLYRDSESWHGVIS